MTSSARFLLAIACLLVNLALLAATDQQKYIPVFSEPSWVVPSLQLASKLVIYPANNNVSICLHNKQLFLAWRTAPTHFASKKTKIHVIASSDQGKTWTHEQTISMGTDLREPILFSFKGRLFLYFFEAGSNPITFRPKTMWRLVRESYGWSQAQAISDREVPWEIKIHQGKAWMSSYRGNHYGLDKSQIEVYFKVSQDGLTWQAVGPQGPVVYTGGVSEVGFEFDSRGNLWAVTRNEDGDASGFGSHLVTAAAKNLSAWQFPDKSNPERYDSPRLLRHQDELYMIARRDLGGPFDRNLNYLPWKIRRLLYWITYSMRPKRTALYHIDRKNRNIVPLLDLPSAGDTGFASIVRTGPHSFLAANYTSPAEESRWGWLNGQISKRGTRIYLIELKFIKQPLKSEASPGRNN